MLDDYNARIRSSLAPILRCVLEQRLMTSCQRVLVTANSTRMQRRHSLLSRITIDAERGSWRFGPVAS